MHCKARGKGLRVREYVMMMMRRVPAVSVVPRRNEPVRDLISAVRVCPYPTVPGPGGSTAGLPPWHVSSSKMRTLGCCHVGVLLPLAAAWFGRGRRRGPNEPSQMGYTSRTGTVLLA
jgi:hypothetical protein